MEALVEDASGGANDVFGQICGQCVAHAVGDSGVLHRDHDYLRGDFGVAVGDNDSLGVVGHAVVDALSHRLLDGDGPEEVLDLTLNLVDIDVAYDDDALEVRTIPFVVVGAQGVIRALVDDLHQSDGEAAAVAAVGHQFLEVLHEDAREARVAHAPFAVDDAALLVDLLAVEREVVAPVVEDKQTGVDGSLACGYVVNIVDGLLDAGVGVELSAELHADALEVLDERAVGEVCGAIEAHVFEEVCEAALALLFLDGAHLLCNVEEGLVLRLFVVADVIGEAVVEVAYAHLRVYGQRLHQLAHVLGLAADGCQSEGSRQKDFSEFHLILSFSYMRFLQNHLLMR